MSTDSTTTKVVKKDDSQIMDGITKLLEAMTIPPPTPPVIAASKAVGQWLAFQMDHGERVLRGVIGVKPETTLFGVPVVVDQTLPDGWMVVKTGDAVRFFQLDGLRLVEMVPPPEWGSSP